jgi:hypothetical protein
MWRALRAHERAAVAMVPIVAGRCLPSLPFHAARSPLRPRHTLRCRDCDANAQEHVLSVLPDVHEHHLKQILGHALASRDKVPDTDYGRLAFAYRLLAERCAMVRATRKHIVDYLIRHSSILVIVYLLCNIYILRISVMKNSKA